MARVLGHLGGTGAVEADAALRLDWEQAGRAAASAAAGPDAADPASRVARRPAIISTCWSVSLLMDPTSLGPGTTARRSRANPAAAARAAAGRSGR